jgi:hypothetical protein
MAGSRRRRHGGNNDQSLPHPQQGANNGLQQQPQQPQEDPPFDNYLEFREWYAQKKVDWAASYERQKNSLARTMSELAATIKRWKGDCKTTITAYWLACYAFATAVICSLVMIFYAPGESVEEIVEQVNLLMTTGLAIAGTTASALTVQFLITTNQSKNSTQANNPSDPSRPVEFLAPVETFRILYLFSITPGIATGVLGIGLKNAMRRGSSAIRVCDKFGYAIITIFTWAARVLSCAGLSIWVWEEEGRTLKSHIDCMILWILLGLGLACVEVVCKYLPSMKGVLQNSSLPMDLASARQPHTNANPDGSQV